MFSPAALIEVTYRKKHRARVHVEPHQFLEGFVNLRFVDDGTDIVITLSSDDADRLAGNITQAASANQVIRAVGG